MAAEPKTYYVVSSDAFQRTQVKAGGTAGIGRRTLESSTVVALFDDKGKAEEFAKVKNSEADGVFTSGGDKTVYNVQSVSLTA